MNVRVDVVIFGGGVAGLWMLALLRESGYSALLLESSALGAGQTICSQGIIHGGTKYSLEGAVSGAAKAISAMPGEWRRALAGDSPVDLRGARLLSHAQLLWCNDAPGPRIAAFFASKVMRARMTALEREALPAPFACSAFRGQVYELDEPVVDVGSVLRCLQSRYRRSLLLTAAGDAERLPSREGLLGLRVCAPDGRVLEVRSQRIVLCAGGSNGSLGRQLGGTEIQSQRRPLTMVMVRGELPMLFGHALGVGSVPRLTVTTHLDESGRRIWYLGGALAEKGIGLSRAAQLQAARDELRATLPWIDQQGLGWAILDIDRSEARQVGGKRPDSSVLETHGPIAAAWPTKLALAPALAETYLRRLDHEGVRPMGQELLPDLADWPRPQLAVPPWDRTALWN